MMAHTVRQRPQTNQREPALLLALDLGLKAWKLGFARDFQETPWLWEFAGGDQTTRLTATAQAKRQLKRLCCNFFIKEIFRHASPWR